MFSQLLFCLYSLVLGPCSNLVFTCFPYMFDTSSMQEAALPKLTGYTLACAVPLVADAFAMS